jgi:hypothetical protein
MFVQSKVLSFSIRLSCLPISLFSLSPIVFVHLIVVCLFVRPSVRLSSCHMYACLSVSLTVCKPACLSVCLSFFLSVCLSDCLPAACLTLCLFICPSDCLSVCLPVCPSFCPPVCRCVCLWVCLSVFLFSFLHSHSSLYLSITLASLAYPECVDQMSVGQKVFDQKSSNTTVDCVFI